MEFIEKTTDSCGGHADASQPLVKAADMLIKEEGRDDQGVVCGEEDAAIRDEDFNWKVRMRPARNPSQTTVKEIEEHEATHCPFKAWCQLV